MEKKQCKGKKPCQQLPSYCDGATRSCCNHHNAIQRSSVVDEESEGVDPENGPPCQETDPIQLCKDENRSRYHHCESYGDDAVSQDKRLRQPCGEREYQNDNGEAIVYPALYLDDCPTLDLQDFSTDIYELLNSKYLDHHSSSVSFTEVAEPEAFIDIHSREHKSDLNENKVDYISCGNSSFHSGSFIDLSLENHLLVIGHSSSGASSLIGSLQHHIIIQSDNEWINHNVGMSDSGQSMSEISFSSSELSDGTDDKKMTEDIRFDSGLPINTSLLSSTHSVDYNLKEQEIKVNSDLLQTDSENKRIMLYNFDKDKLMKNHEDISFDSEFPINTSLLSSTHSVNSTSKGQEDEQNLVQSVSEIERKMTYNFDKDKKVAPFNSDAYDPLCHFEHHSKERKRRNHEHLVADTSHENSTLTTENISPLDSSINYIMFYIIHKTSSQKLITFHTLEVKQDCEQKTFCRLKSFGLPIPRGLWLLNHLERLGLLTFHQITPTVLIVEPALHGLGGYFQQMAQGQRVTVMDSMQYEWMRVRSFWSFPRNAGVSYLQLARLGFYYTGRVSETCCYSCGRIYREWKEGDDPVEIHRRLSPNCPHLNGQEARNRPIYPDINQQWPAIPWDPFGDPGEGPREGEGPPDLVGAESSDRDTEQTSVEDNRSQPRGAEVNVTVETTHDLPSLEANPLSNIAQPRPQCGPEIGRQDLSQVETNPAVLDSTPHAIPEAKTIVDPSGPGSVSSKEGTSSRQSGESDRSAQGHDPPAANPGPQQQSAHRPDESVPRGVPRTDPRTQYMPRYPLYAGQEHRAESFRNGWPAYLNQTAHEMASAGFYYAGNGDYCRCFHCGGGLRNWEPGDDPWVEHARWFPNCLFVRQNKGERFVRLVQQRQENNRQNEPPRQEPVLQLPPANQPTPPPVERNQLQGQATPQSNQQSQQARSLPPTGQQSQGQGGTAAAARQSAKDNTEAPVDEMSLAAVESLKVNGISSSRIHQALQIWKKQRKKEYKITDITSADLMQIIFDMEDEENRRFTEASSQFASALSLTSTEPAGGERSDGAGAQFLGITSEGSASTDPEMAELVALQNEIEERKKKLMCSVCGENEVTIAFIPCGHLVVCYQCAPAMITCPNCREPVKGSVKVYLM